MVALLKSSASPLTASFWPHLRGSKVPPEGNMLEQNPFKLHINMHQGWHFCCKHKNLLCQMLGTWQSLSEVMTLITELLQHCMWRVVIVLKKRWSLRVITSDKLCQVPSIWHNKFLCLQQKCHPQCMFIWSLKGFYSDMFPSGGALNSLKWGQNEDVTASS